MRHGDRDLTPEEEQLWAQVVRTVTPLSPLVSARARPGKGAGKPMPPVAPSLAGGKRGKSAPVPTGRPAAPHPVSAPRQPLDARGLDGGWDRRLTKGAVVPDFTLDLHGCTLEMAHARLLHGLAQARAMGARVVLLITGKPRPVDAADRGERRGAIRAKTIDWIAHSEHGPAIAAIRAAHPRHGGQGALYLVLKRRRG